MTPAGPKRRRPGRVEAALDHELRRETAVPEGGRAHLRWTAEQLDRAAGAEANAGTLTAAAKLTLAYLTVRQSYGLAGDVKEPLDPFAAFVAGMSAPRLRDAGEP